MPHPISHGLFTGAVHCQGATGIWTGGERPIGREQKIRGREKIKATFSATTSQMEDLIG